MTVLHFRGRTYYETYPVEVRPDGLNEIQSGPYCPYVGSGLNRGTNWSGPGRYESRSDGHGCWEVLVFSDKDLLAGRIVSEFGDVLSVEECDFLPPELPKPIWEKQPNGYYGYTTRAYYPKKPRTRRNP